MAAAVEQSVDDYQKSWAKLPRLESHSKIYTLNSQKFGEPEPSVLRIFYEENKKKEVLMEYLEKERIALLPPLFKNTVRIGGIYASEETQEVDCYSVYKVIMNGGGSAFIFNLEVLTFVEHEGEADVKDA